MSTMSPQELWTNLTKAGLSQGEMPEAEEPQTPWYVRVLQGIAGVIAASFLLGFVAMGMMSLMSNHIASIVGGTFAVAVAFALFSSSPHSNFGALFALSISLAGQFLLMFGIFGALGFTKNIGLTYAIATAIQGTLAIVMPNFLHRLFSAFGTAYAFSGTCSAFGLPFIAPGLISAGIAWLWLNEAELGKWHSTATPISYGLTLSLIYMEGSTFASRLAMSFVSPQSGAIHHALLWAGEALVAASLLATVIILIKRAGWPLNKKEAIISIATTLLIGAASLKAPGIAGGLMIMLLGFANGNRLLCGLGIVSLLFYTSSYYYLLTSTLLFKAAVLLATGIVLLAARWVVLNIIIPGETNRA